MRTLLITPPLLQPNAPYAAGPLLAAWMKERGHDVRQADLSLALLRRLFSREGTRLLLERVGFPEAEAAPWVERVEEAIDFLCGRNPAAASEFSRRGSLPEGEGLRRAHARNERLKWNFRGLPDFDRARHLTALWLDDLAAVARREDAAFGFSRYGESLAAALPSFAPLREWLEGPKSLFVEWLESLTDREMAAFRPELVALTVPFPGCLPGALTVARRIRETAPGVRIALGGGYVNTELRELAEPALFDYVDAVCLDSGFLPLARLAEGGPPVRTFVREAGAVRLLDDPSARDPAHGDLPAPVYDGLRLEDYFGLFETLNPVVALWSERPWNRLMAAQGCHWARCAFCDVSLDYVRRHDPAAPGVVCDWMESTMRRTGFSGFHFVDESLPPALIDGLCDEILRRGLRVEWWGNVRFLSRFAETALPERMAAAGCLAVTGGLETVCDRTLGLMRKGVSVAGAERALRAFASAGILTHAYLMYGFPTQTLSETMAALETVRRLFDEGSLHSAYWHRFALTAHSEAMRRPDRFGIRPLPDGFAGFARNEVPFAASFDHDLDVVGRMLRGATYNYSLGIGLDERPARRFAERFAGS